MAAIRFGKGANNPTTVTKEVYEYWLTTLENEGRRMTIWERQFTESLREQFDEKGYLSPAQVSKLENIYATRTS